MAKDPLQVKLDKLRYVLYAVEHPESVGDSRAALQTAHRHLDELARDIRISQEQSRLAALYRVSQVLGTSLDLDIVLTRVMDAVIRMAGAERGFLVLLDAKAREWKLRAARNFSQETLEQKDVEVSRTVLNTVIEDGQGIVTTDAQSDPRFSGQDSVIIYAPRSIMCAPLLSRGKMIGAIYVDSRTQVGLFTDDDLELLNAFAVQAAIAIENARLYTQTDQALTQRVAELEILAQIDHELNTGLDFGHVMGITRKWAIRVGEASRVWVLLREDEEDDEITRFIAFPPDFGDSEAAIVRRSLVESSPQVSEPGDGAPARLIVPIVHSGKPLGVIVLERPDQFTESDIGFLVHLSGRVAAAIENARLYQAVQQANQEKSKFVSVVTHELRIPMTSIKGYADLIRQGAVGSVNEQQLNFLDVIRSNVERMGTLVSDLSDISRIETGRLKLDCSLVPVQEYVEETMRSLKPKLEEKDQSLELEVPPDLPQVYADPNRLIQIMTNLVSNAWKYTPVGGAICIAARAEGAFVRVEVVDNGIGISPEDQYELFKQFFRSEEPLVREEQGWGLGLNVAKRLVELMGGTIGVSSSLGAGSTFWFTLPISESNGKS